MRKMNGNKETFYRVTNAEMYKLLQDIHNDLDVIKTQLRVNKYMSSLAITISLMVAGALVGKYI